MIPMTLWPFCDLDACNSFSHFVDMGGGILFQNLAFKGFRFMKPKVKKD